jgi:hypothetical protein
MKSLCCIGEIIYKQNETKTIMWCECSICHKECIQMPDKYFKNERIKIKYEQVH